MKTTGSSKGQKLSEIAQEIETCEECRAWGSGKAVPGEGNPDAALLFVGEAPGKEEAKTGRPFVGRSGRLLREMIRGIGLQEEEVFITSPVKYLPKRGTPTRENIAHSRSHFLRQLSVIDPSIVVLLGSVACFAVLGRTVPITKEHGRIVREGGRIFFITYHPAAALRFPEKRRELLQDFRLLKERIEEEEKDISRLPGKAS
ncbi:MAG: uracil-DNA glycosylase [Thermodesulfovibrionales bacterium]